MSEQDKASMARIPLELFNKGDLAVADQVVSANYIEHAELPPGFPTGIDGLKQFVTQLRLRSLISNMGSTMPCPMATKLSSA
jgi:hypothetical protein